MHSDSLISIRHFDEGVLPRRAVIDDQPLSPGDPALLAVTDFTREPPATIDEDRQIDAALEDMVRIGVRALLVVREQRVVGLVTSYDIQGERPLQFLGSSTYSHHRDLSVAHIMTPWDKLHAVDWAHLQMAHAGDLLQVVEEAGVTHLLVVDAAQRGARPLVRGLVSRARLRRQLQPLKRVG